MIVEREDNSALYFIVGALLVAVAAFAFYYFSANGGSSTGDTASDTTRVENTAPSAGESHSTSLSVDGNTVKATTQTQQ